MNNDEKFLKPTIQIIQIFTLTDNAVYKGYVRE